MKEALEEYRIERAKLEDEIHEFLTQKFADFKEKTGAEVIHFEVNIELPDDYDASAFIENVFVGTDL
ncbi:hypothetical protein [Acinetobacter silvestris]|uniref:Uncharacterized protein n=1 Tax=Acinetobacter silvestris TaxID=1977882 RepID=A0A1Y3CDT8_9GAMM|nr:hypothetical protein [Acinetobacter silvestris]OTG65237.1 hypothetical protein B9T28_09690 [Acinetobacter silvestris]